MNPTDRITTTRLGRRQLLQGIGGLAGVMALSGLPGTNTSGVPPYTGDPFTLGVASGDPLPDGVVLWTRLAPDPLAADAGGGLPAQPFGVQWQVAEDERFRSVVRQGAVEARPELAHSVHVEVSGLKPGREYWYRFKSGSAVSPVGRTKTAPAFGAMADTLALGIVSCQLYLGDGTYAAHRNLAQEDLDLVVHLGDYIYERHDTASLTDFRNLHALYKTSADLQQSHARFPYVVTFDDHEVDNDWAAYYSQEYPRVGFEEFAAIRGAAFQAYYEHLPLRRSSLPAGPDMQLYRRLRYGRLAELSVLDTRQYRSDQVGSGFPSGPRDPQALDPARTMTGDQQEQWLLDGLGRSDARWNVLAQQTIMAEYDYDTGDGVAINHDQWDGYAASRRRILEGVAARRPSNPVVLSGDWHSSWVNDLKVDFTDPAAETVATEFVGTSISSGCGWAGDIEAARSVNPHVKFFDGSMRGYVRCTITPDQWRTDFRVVPSPTDPVAPATTLSSWVVENGRTGAEPA
jgi:alkaline phosphatase D